MRSRKSISRTIDETNRATETAKRSNAIVIAGTVRAMLGITMLIAGLYFWLFYGGEVNSLGLLFLIGSPLIILTDKKADGSCASD